MAYPVSQTVNAPVTLSAFLNDNAAVNEFERILAVIFKDPSLYSVAVSTAVAAASVPSSLRLSSSQITVPYTLTYITYNTNQVASIARLIKKNITDTFLQSSIDDSFDEAFAGSSSSSVQGMTYSSGSSVTVSDAQVTFVGSSSSSGGFPIYFIIAGAVIAAIIVTVIPLLVYHFWWKKRNGYSAAPTNATGKIRRGIACTVSLIHPVYGIGNDRNNRNRPPATAVTGIVIIATSSCVWAYDLVFVVATSRPSASHVAPVPAAPSAPRLPSQMNRHEENSSFGSNGHDGGGLQLSTMSSHAKGGVVL